MAHLLQSNSLDAPKDRAAVIPAKRSASRDRKKIGASIRYDPGQGFAFRDDGGGGPLAHPANEYALSAGSPVFDCSKWAMTFGESPLR